MSREARADEGWFAGLERGAMQAAREAIMDGSAEEPADWPALAVAAGFAETEEDYYAALHEAAVHAARESGHERETASDQMLSDSLRAMDDCTEKANELAERVSEWAGSYYGEDDGGFELVNRVADRDPDSRVAEQLVALAETTLAVAARRDALRTFIEREAPSVAPNLAAIAGPVLAARLISLAGGLEALAKKPSGTVQVLGAEDALFAHLQGRGSSPKHGVIFTHEYVAGTRPEDRGSAARALAGKLSIAARVDYYSGERKPEIDDALAARIERIRERTP